jgi:integrase
MARERSGYVYQEKVCFGAVKYVDGTGKQKIVKRRASGKVQAQEIAQKLLQELIESGQKVHKASTETLTELGEWYARTTFIDESGKRRNVKRRVENRTDGREELKRILRDLDDHGEKTLDGERMTFGDLASYYEKTYVIPAEYKEGRKIAGRRSYRQTLTLLGYLRNYFGTRKLRSITHGDIERYKAKRMATTTVRKTPRSITSVNRELQLMRAIFNVAAREGWVIKNPFVSGKSLISVADERQRERILTKEEEERLLAACTGRREHLMSIVVCALDTGCRLGEILKLKWEDVDFENHILTIKSLNTKTLRERQIAMTERLAKEMKILYELSAKDTNILVFGITSNVKRSFHTVRKAAGLVDVRFHDLRHTHATRLVAAHIPLSEVGRALGHTQANTTYRYVNANVETARRAAAALNEFNRSVDEGESPIIN